MHSWLINKVGWEVNIKSIQHEEFSKTCVGSFITRYNPHCDEIFNIAIPSKFDWSCLQVSNLALKSPRRTMIYGAFCITQSRVGCKVLEKDSNSSDDWVGDL